MARSPDPRAAGPGYGLPPADTGTPVLNWISDSLEHLVRLERRIDPFIRPAFDALLRDRIADG
jgi:hypothetical protein